MTRTPPLSGIDYGVLSAGQAQSLVFGVFRDDDHLTGYVADPADFEIRFVVELVVDGWPLDITRANRFDDRMAERGVPVLDYGFAFDLRKIRLTDWTSLTVRVANSAVILATFSPGTPIAPTGPPVRGAVAWESGLRFRGWLARASGDAIAVRAIIDEDLVAECNVSGLTMIEDGSLHFARPTFDLHLPARFADGKVHHLDVVDNAGLALSGSPVSFLAFEDGLAAVLDSKAEVPGEQIRGTEYDRLFPRSAPFSAIAGWIKRFPLTSEPADSKRVVLVLVGEEGTEETIASLSGSRHDWLLGVLPSLSGSGKFDREDFLDFVKAEGADRPVVVVALAGTVFADDALDRLAGALSLHPASNLAYCDVLARRHASEVETAPASMAFSSFDYERMIEQGYAGWCFASSTSDAVAAVAAGASSLLSLFFALLGGPSEGRPVHVPGFLATIPAIDSTAASVLQNAVLAHLSSRGIRADVALGRGTLFPSILVKRASTAEIISVIVATHNGVEDLRACLDHLRGLRTRHRLEVIIADMASSEGALLRYLSRPETRLAQVVRIDGALNMARAFNKAAACSTNRYLLYLDPLMRLEDPDPLENLVSRCADPTTAAAGPALVWPGGIVQAYGLILGFGCGAAPAGRGLGDDDPGYGDMMRVAQERSALPTACLLVKRDDHVAIGGFDEAAFGRVFHAVDYGLRLRARGRRLVVTPHARAVCRQDLLAKALDAPEAQAASLRRELATLRSRWGDVLNDDPFYSPLLALEGDLHSALAWPPRRRPNAAIPPVQSKSGARS